MKYLLHSFILFVITALLGCSINDIKIDNSAKKLAQKLLNESKIAGGLIVHYKSGDGQLTAALRANESYIVHGLEQDITKVDSARKFIQSLDIYGPVSVEQWDADYLPYSENSVNLFITQEIGNLNMDEVSRVLTPGGTALIKNNDTMKGIKIKGLKLTQKGEWLSFNKQWPDSIDEWTHFLHGPDNNAVAMDRVVGPPDRIQWETGPKWQREHDTSPSIFAMMSAKGRLFYIQDDGPIGVIDERLPEKHILVARDAFNGVLLWKRPIEGWYSNHVIWGHIPVHAQRRLIASEDRVYLTPGLQKPVIAIDASSGKIIREYKGTEHTGEMVLDNDLLAIVIRKTHPLDGEVASRDRKTRYRPFYQGPETTGEALMVVDINTGQQLWKQNRKPVPVTLAMQHGRILIAEKENVVCIDAKSGNELWTRDFSACTIVLYKDIVFTANYPGKRSNIIEINAFNLEDGALLWKKKGDCLPAYRTFFATVDLFVSGGLLWGFSENINWRKGDLTGDVLGVDVKTGEIRKRIPCAGALTPGKHHIRCWKGKATERFLLFGNRGIGFVNIDQSQKTERRQWVRGVCRYGVLPCNGLIYAPSNGCSCFPGALLNGFYALASYESKIAKSISSNVEIHTTEAGDPLEKGEAYFDSSLEKSNQFSENHKDDWSTYRHDARRSGASSCLIPDRIKKIWSASIGGRLSALSAAGGKVFVASVDKHQVYALDAKTGERLWHFTAGGRVDSPPTIHEDRVVFGSKDGYVYCLRASDGALIWRYRGAPGHRKAGAFNQLESAWPVHGSVLVKNNAAYFTAGRSSFLDGGIYVSAVDISTGKLLHSKQISGPDPNRNDIGIYSRRLPGASSDILVTDGENLYMRNIQLNDRLSNTLDADALSWQLDGYSHFLATSGFLDNTLFNRTVWQYGDYVKRSQLLVFDEEAIYGVRIYSGVSWNAPIYNIGEGFILFCRSIEKSPAKNTHINNKQKKLPQELFRIPYEKFRWHTRSQLRINAMVLTSGKDKRLIAAGSLDIIDKEDPFASFEGRGKAGLLIYSARDGRKRSEYQLDSPPVFDGMIAAYGCLYISTMSGNIECFGGE